MAAFLEICTPAPRDFTQQVPPLQRVTCDLRRHQSSAGGAPVLAEVFETSLGPLFVAAHEGSYPDWGPDQTPGQAAIPVEAISPPSDDGDWPLPVQWTCILLTDENPPDLRVKCREHGLFRLDLARLSMAYDLTLARRRTGRRAAGKAPDTDTPIVVRLPEVVAGR